MDSLNLSKDKGSFFRTFDSLEYHDITKKNSDKMDESRSAIFKFNGESVVKPKILEMQNFLEKGEQYQEKYAEKSPEWAADIGLSCSS